MLRAELGTGVMPIEAAAKDLALERPGVYALVVGARVYIGSSKNVRARIAAHVGSIKRGTHPNGKISAAFSASMDIAGAKLLEVCARSELIDKEQAWLDKRGALELLNIGSAAVPPLDPIVARRISAAKKGRPSTFSAEQRARMSRLVKRRWADPEWRAKFMLRRSVSDERREQIGKRSRALWQCPEYKAKMARRRGHIQAHTPETREVLRKRRVEWWKCNKTASAGSVVLESLALARKRGCVNGGIAAMARLTPEQRRERSRRAAQARWRPGGPAEAGAGWVGRGHIT